jgi:hypothetical protein
MCAPRACVSRKHDISISGGGGGGTQIFAPSLTPAYRSAPRLFSSAPRCFCARKAARKRKSFTYTFYYVCFVFHLSCSSISFSFFLFSEPSSLTCPFLPPPRLTSHTPLPPLLKSSPPHQTLPATRHDRGLIARRVRAAPPLRDSRNHDERKECTPSARKGALAPSIGVRTLCPQGPNYEIARLSNRPDERPKVKRESRA